MARLPAPWRGGPRGLSVLDTLRDSIDKLFDDFFATPGGWGLRTPTGQVTFAEFLPDIDVIEREDRYLVRAELPGVKPEDIEVSCSEDALTIRGEKEEETIEEGDTYYISERCFGEFQRTIPLPKGVDMDHIEARYENGVLEVIAPKSESTRARKIEIKRREQGAQRIEAGEKKQQAPVHKKPEEGARERPQGEKERR